MDWHQSAEFYKHINNISSKFVQSSYVIIETFTISTAKCWSYITFVHTTKVNGIHCCLNSSIFQSFLCPTEEWRFGMTWGWVNDDNIFIFGWTIPLNACRTEGGIQNRKPLPIIWSFPENWTVCLTFRASRLFLLMPQASSCSLPRKASSMSMQPAGLMKCSHSRRRCSPCTKTK